MYYSDAILTKKGALAKVWLAAHMESKLTKLQVGSVDVEQSVNDILKDQQQPMALRLSGQLLLGVCRIYSRKAKYLLDDCTEALVTLKMQIRPALVDLPEDQLVAPNIDITVDDGAEFGFDLDWNVPLPELFAPLNHLSQAGSMSISSFSGPRRSHYSFDVGPSDGFASHDFDVNLGLDLGLPAGSAADDDADETYSAVEFGRDAAPFRSARESIGSKFGSVLRGDLGEGEELIRDPFGVGLDLDDPLAFEDEPMDLGLDIGSPRQDADDPFGGQMGEGMDYEYGEGMEMGMDDFDFGQQRADRESSRLTTPPTEGSALHSSSIAGNLSPRTAAQIAALANRQEAALAIPAADGATPAKRKKTVRIIVDATTELEPETYSQATASQANRGEHKDLSAILQPQKFIPSSATLRALQSIRTDPTAFYLPIRQPQGGEAVLYAGPRGLGGELEKLFMVSVGGLLRRREGQDEEEEGREEGPKRARTGEDEEEDDEVEQGRRRDSSRAPSNPRAGRASSVFSAGQDKAPYVAPSELDYQDFGGGQDVPFDEEALGELGGDQFDDLSGEAPFRRGFSAAFEGDEEEEERLRNDRPRAGSRARSVAFSEVDEGDLPRGPRRPRSSRGGSTARSLGAAETEEGESQSAREREKGRAVEMLMRDLKVSEDEEKEDQEDKVISFRTVNDKVSRRAASAFFFELLVLGTKDHIKLSQSEPYGDIQVRAKEKLFAAAAGSASVSERSASAAA